MSATEHRVAIKGARKILECHYDGLTSVPLEDDWAIQEVEIGEGVVRKLRDIGAARVVERGDARLRYTLVPAFAERLATHEPKSPQLPCSHHGFRNVGDGAFECAYDGCHARFDRETIEGVLAG